MDTYCWLIVVVREVLDSLRYDGHVYLHWYSSQVITMDKDVYRIDNQDQKGVIWFNKKLWEWIVNVF